MTVRDARPDELDRIADLMVHAYSQYQTEIPPFLWEDYAGEIRDVRRRLPYSELIVAEHEGRIVGAVTFYRDASLSEHQGWPPTFAEIRLLAVDPAARGLGIGRVLTEECIRRARENGNPSVGLHTSRLMHVARDMYERIGFVRCPEYDFTPSQEFDVVATAYRYDL